MYPATGSAHSTCSPSRRTTMRSVPCVAGCWGPMLRVMPSASSSTLTRASAAWAAMYAVRWRSETVPVIASRLPLRALALVRLARDGLDVDQPGPRLHGAGQQGEVLAQRVALELARQVQVAQPGMALE